MHKYLKCSEVIIKKSLRELLLQNWILDRIGVIGQRIFYVNHSPKKPMAFKGTKND